MKLIPYFNSNNNNNLNTAYFIKANKIWKKSEAGDGVIIAVIDTGVQRTHPFFKKSIIDGKNFTSDYNYNHLNYNDNNGHGTHVAGIIKQVAPKAKLLVLKALSGHGNGNYNWIIEAIDFATQYKSMSQQRVNIICMSLGGPYPDEKLHQSIKSAIEQNISVVVAAGNEGDGSADTNEFVYPGYYNEVIQVGAIDYNLNTAYFSNTNNQIDLVAPGVNIYSSYLADQFTSLSGTSMAAPHVAGAIALLINKSKKLYGRELTGKEIYAQLIKRTVSLGYPKNIEGNGLIQLDLDNKIMKCPNYNAL